MDDAQKQYYAEQALLAVNEILPVGDVEFNDWGAIRMLVTDWFSLCNMDYTLSTGNRTWAWLLNQIAFYLYAAKADYTKAEPLYQRSLAIFEKALGKNHPDIKQVRESYGLFLAEKAAGK